MKKLAFAIPAYNESDRLNKTLHRLDSWLKHSSLLKDFEILCVITDDGSFQPVNISKPNSPSEGFGFNVVLLRHICNLGQGAALQTSTEYAVENWNADLVVHMDSDGQHRPEDLPSLLEPILKNQADIVFGNRFHNQESAMKVPLTRRLLLRLATTFERALTGLTLTDAHNGYRAMNQKVAGSMQIFQNRMAHATEIKQWVAVATKRHGIRYTEAPVTIDYTDETLGKGQKSSGAIRILKELMDSYLFGE